MRELLEDNYYITCPEEAIKTRFPSPIKPNYLSEEEKIEIIESHFQAILETLGLNLEERSLQKTPRRVAEMYVKEIFSGLNEETFPKISIVQDEFHHQNNPHIVFVSTHFTSFCEHHLVPIHGIAYVAYKPRGKLIGLSKIPRIVRFFAKRPQVQERLTAQIADCLAQLLDNDDVAVSISATHFCVVARGIEDQNGTMTTNVLRGEFSSNDTLHREFFEAVNRQVH